MRAAAQMKKVCSLLKSNAGIDINETQPEKTKTTAILINTVITKTVTDTSENTTAATTTINLYKPEAQQQETSTGNKQGVKCNTITINMTADAEAGPTITIDDIALKNLISNGGDIGINDIFKLW